MGLEGGIDPQRRDAPLGAAVGGPEEGFGTLNLPAQGGGFNGGFEAPLCTVAASATAGRDDHDSRVLNYCAFRKG